MSESGKEKNTDINKRLETIIGILLSPSKFQNKTMGEKIIYLISQGYENQQIANILDTTTNMVAKEKSKAKKVKTNE
ncbi:MAG: hypothetical protein WBE60_05965 [Nitrosotalea sp.]